MAEVLKRPRYQTINGIRIPDFFSPKCFNETLNYKPKPADVFIVTYPKCGTTWMQNIAMYIFRKGKEMDHPQDFLRLCPFIDMIGAEGITKMPRPGAMKTHLPYTHMPYSSEAKYIFVARNPKDCCVSLYYHTRDHDGYGYWGAEFDDFFEIFMAGEVEYNDYFDHLMSWYPHRNDSNIFYTKYEDMKKDTKNVVIKLAKFLGKEYIDAIEQDNGVLNNILKFSSFEYMKIYLSAVYELNSDSTVLKEFEGLRYLCDYAGSLNPPEDKPKPEFVRKGIVGDWRSHFSEIQSNRLNQKFLERTKDT
ncbi:Sulfotransferase 1C4, partial [Stegodyphus mimosarum]